jgi:hypothetical protein
MRRDTRPIYNGGRYTTPGNKPLHHSALPMVFTFRPKALAMWR